VARYGPAGAATSLVGVPDAAGAPWAIALAAWAGYAGLALLAGALALVRRDLA
jgi:hypothetical protein